MKAASVALLALSSVLAPSAQDKPQGCSKAVGVGLPTRLESRLQLAADPAAPLLVVFHGKNGCIGAVQGQSTLDTDQRGVSVLWLTGEGGVWDGWYSGADRTYAYVLEALEAVHEAGGSPSTVVAVGISMGAVMAMWAACTLPEFDAAVTIAGTARLSKCAHRGLSLLVIGGASDGSTNPPGAEMPPALAARWRALSVTCGDPAVLDRGQVHEVVSGCANGALIREVTVSGVGHVWPFVPGWDTDAEIVRFARSVGFSLPGEIAS